MLDVFAKHYVVIEIHSQNILIMWNINLQLLSPSQIQQPLVCWMQVLRELVLKYRENIIHVRTAADHMEEKLKAEILFLKEQIQAEQCLKENLEETLQLEIENCKEEIGEKKLSLGDWGM